MSISDLVNITISANTVNPTAPGFGTPLIAAYHTHWPDRLRYYSSLAGMTGDGFAVTEPAYLAASKVLAQNPTVNKFAIGRRALAPAQVLNLTLTDTVSGDVYSFSLVGSDGVSHAVTMNSTGVPATDATSLAALLTFTNIGTVSHVGAVVTLTQSAGKLNDILNWSNNFQLTDTTADPGIATDLAAIYAVDATGWYGLALDSNSKAEILAAAAWTESNKKLFATNNSDFNCVTNATTDVFSTLKTSTYTRTYCQYSGVEVLCFAGAAMLGNRLQSNPGSDTWAYKTLAGVPADSNATMPENNQINLGNKNGNWYITVANLNLTLGGSTINGPGGQGGISPSGEFMDIVRFIDWLQANMQIDILALLAGSPKIPYTDVGIGQVSNVIKTRLKIGGNPPYGGLDLTQPFSITIPTVATVDPVNKANRNLPNVQFSAKLSGAIQATTITGTVS